MQTASPPLGRPIEDVLSRPAPQPPAFIPHPHFCLFCPPSLNLFFWFSPPPERRVSAPPPSRMVVRIRLARWGRRHLPFFRIVVADGRSPRDGRHLDVVGSYNAAGHSAAEVAARVKRVELDVARIKYWLSVGAQPSDTGTCVMLVYRELAEGGRWGARRAGVLCRLVGAPFRRPFFADQN